MIYLGIYIGLNEPLLFNKYVLQIPNDYKCSRDILHHQMVRASSVIYVAS